jgi:hypothetical protein
MRKGAEMKSKSPYRPEGLTDEQFARYQELCNEEPNDEEVEAEIREILAHPESWVSAEQIMKDVEAICGKTEP